MGAAKQRVVFDVLGSQIRPLVLNGNHHKQCCRYEKSAGDQKPPSPTQEHGGGGYDPVWKETRRPYSRVGSIRTVIEETEKLCSEYGRSWKGEQAEHEDVGEDFFQPSVQLLETMIPCHAVNAPFLIVASTTVLRDIIPYEPSEPVKTMRYHQGAPQDRFQQVMAGPALLAVRICERSVE